MLPGLLSVAWAQIAGATHHWRAALNAADAAFAGQRAAQMPGLGIMARSQSEYLREELEVDRVSAQRLLPSIRDVTDAMIYHHGAYEMVAEELWVDPWMLEVRLSGLRPLERGYYERRLADVPLLGLGE